MPIRFRCSQCDRLLGIAKRKAGTRINCPQCGEETTVPSEDQPDPVDDRTLRELDNLLIPANAGLLAPPEPAVSAGSALAAPVTRVIAVMPAWLSSPITATTRP